uniref:Uncharacterized protein n=1 Tax=Amphimedon queenslandica TaxID=400682 RepID=A0A1X7VKP1_AMPQE
MIVSAIQAAVRKGIDTAVAKTLPAVSLPGSAGPTALTLPSTQDSLTLPSTQAASGLSGGRPPTSTSAFHTLPLVSLGQLPSATATVPSSPKKESPGVIVSPSLPPILSKVIDKVKGAFRGFEGDVPG